MYAPLDAYLCVCGVCLCLGLVHYMQAAVLPPHHLAGLTAHLAMAGSAMRGGGRLRLGVGVTWHHLHAQKPLCHACSAVGVLMES